MIDRGPASRWQTLGYLYAITAAAIVAYYVAHIPVQVSDSLGNMLQIQHETYWHLFENQLWAEGYFRPLLWVQIKAAFDLANGHEWVTFKGIHAAQLIATALLFVRLLRVHDIASFAAMTLGVAVLFGLHTFSGTVREAFPINTFLTIVVCVLAAANLSISAPRLWNDLLAALLTAFALLTVESGVLVVAAIVAGRLAGFDGVSRTGAAICVALLAAYLGLRFTVFDIGTPALLERASGFGFRVLDPVELNARFGEERLTFYGYNVLASLLTVLFSEPRSGVWSVAKALTEGTELPAWMTLNVATSIAATVIALPFTARALIRWARGTLEYRDRLVLVAAAVIAGNAVLGFPYTKDVIMSTGGVFFALAVAAACSSVLVVAQRLGVASRVLIAATLVVVSAGWAVRAAGLTYLLREQAFRTRNDWALVYPWLEEQQIGLKSEAARKLVEALRSQALSAPVPHPNFDRPDFVQYMDTN